MPCFSEHLATSILFVKVKTSGALSLPKSTDPAARLLMMTPCEPKVSVSGPVEPMKRHEV